ncbi:MAG: VWA domain-containing protein [Firmicutes bacterium]|nr:VWA domain-containing protein [Bacillota bacterium]
MEKQILGFVHHLRQAGLHVSPAEVLDCLNAVGMVGFGKKRFKSALRATLIKDFMDERIFESLFDLYFNAWKADLPPGAAPPDGALPGDALPGDALPGDALPVASFLPGAPAGVKAQGNVQPHGAPGRMALTDSPGGEGQGRGGRSRGRPGARSSGANSPGASSPGANPIQRFLEAVHSGDAAALAELADEAVANLGEIAPERLADLEELLREAQVSIEWFGAVNKLQLAGKRGEMPEEEFQRATMQVARLEELLRRRLERALVEAFGARAIQAILRQVAVRQTDFNRLSVEQIQAVRRQVARLGRGLATRYGRRYGSGRHGRMDLRRTIRRAAVTGGVPIFPAFQHRVVSRPDLVVLCDVSRSVAAFSQFLLQLVYSMQGRFRAVRSFIFVDRITEVTDQLRRQDIRSALEEIFGGDEFWLPGASDYGSVFYAFAREYLPELTDRTTLLILGDARNNWHPDEKDSLRKIAGRVRRVIWLNPKPRQTWDTEDSIMGSYALYCAQVFECRNLAQLEAVAGEIFTARRTAGVGQRAVGINN